MSQEECARLRESVMLKYADVYVIYIPRVNNMMHWNVIRMFPSVWSTKVVTGQFSQNGTFWYVKIPNFKVWYRYVRHCDWGYYANELAVDQAEITVSSSDPVVVCILIAAEMCFLIRCQEMGCITPLRICSLHSNCCTCHSIFIRLSEDTLQ
jgi:hypothetical protein